jgi:di/tricarboxylate transporter
LSALNIVPIAFAAIAACVVVLWLKCITPEQAYKAVDWSILFMLYGMLAVGSAMESSGAAKWLADIIVHNTDGLVSDAWRPLLVLSLFYLLGSVLTEVLSNNATALVLAPIAINAAMSPEMNLDPRPFVFAVAFSSSAAFSTPIGYQTHMMVYGPGGYRFSDFVKVGLPLNLILWGVASWYLPLNWPF